MKHFIGFWMMILCLHGLCMGQETFAVAGIDVKGSGGTVGITVGQPDYGVISGGNASFVSGVQQPFDIEVATGTDPLADGLPACRIWPNPVTRSLVLSIGETSAQGYTYSITGADGKILEEGAVMQPETSISMDSFKPSLYFLKVMKESKNVKTFKILKN